MTRSALLLLLLVTPVLGGCLLPDNKPRVSIEFGAIPELEGAEVLVDGKTVGKLERTGQATRIAFPVEKGKHEVTLRHPRFGCQPITVNAELDAQKMRLMADISDGMSLQGGDGRPMVILRP